VRDLQEMKKELKANNRIQKVSEGECEDEIDLNENNEYLS